MKCRVGERQEKARFLRIWKLRILTLNWQPMEKLHVLEHKDLLLSPDTTEISVQ